MYILYICISSDAVPLGPAASDAVPLGPAALAAAPLGPAASAAVPLGPAASAAAPLGPAAAAAVPLGPVAVAPASSAVVAAAIPPPIARSRQTLDVGSGVRGKRKASSKGSNPFSKSKKSSPVGHCMSG